MAFCGKCGSEVKDGVKFCSKCGAPIKTAEAAAAANATGSAAGKPAAAPVNRANTTAQTTSTVQYPYKNNYTEPEDYNIRTLLKKFGGSPLFLIYIIAAIAALVLTIVVSGNFTVFGILALLIIYIPTILCIIGMILGFADARSNEIPEGNGIGLYKAGKIIEIVFMVIIGVVGILLLVFNGLMINGYGDKISETLKAVADKTNMEFIKTFTQFGNVEGVAMVVVIVMIVLVAAIVLLAVFYNLFLLFSASAIRKSLESGKRTGYVSMYPAVILIIGAVCSVISLLGAIFTFSGSPAIVEEISDRVGDIDVASVLSGISLTSTLAMVLFGLLAVKYIVGAILLFSLKSKIRED